MIRREFLCWTLFVQLGRAQEFFYFSGEWVGWGGLKPAEGRE